jgi:cytochrome c553
VEFGQFYDVVFEADAKTPAETAINKTTTMKRIFILAAAIGFAVAWTASAADSKENWNKLCARCHGEDGRGQTNIGKKLGARDYTDPKIQAALTDAAAFKATKKGLKDKDGKTLMKPYDNLSDDDIKGLVAYLRTFEK